MYPSHLILWLGLLTSTICAQHVLPDSVLTMVQSSSGIPGKESIIRLKIENRVYSALIQNGDTIIVANLGNINISSPKNFENHNDYLKYIKYRRYASTVFPYAKEAIRIFTEADNSTKGLKKRKRKKQLRRLSKELKIKFEKPLKTLSKTQGKILIKMIERELDRSMYDLIKGTNGWWKAMYWNRASRLYGYKLKEKYEYGQDRILDVVLIDFNISSDLSLK